MGLPAQGILLTRLPSSGLHCKPSGRLPVAHRDQITALSGFRSPASGMGFRSLHGCGAAGESPTFGVYSHQSEVRTILKDPIPLLTPDFRLLTPTLATPLFHASACAWARKILPQTELLKQKDLEEIKSTGLFQNCC